MKQKIFYTFNIDIDPIEILGRLERYNIKNYSRNEPETNTKIIETFYDTETNMFYKNGGFLRAYMQIDFDTGERKMFYDIKYDYSDTPKRFEVAVDYAINDFAHSQGINNLLYETLVLESNENRTPLQYVNVDLLSGTHEPNVDLVTTTTTITDCFGIDVNDYENVDGILMIKFLNMKDVSPTYRSGTTNAKVARDIQTALSNFEDAMLKMNCKRVDAQKYQLIMRLLSEKFGLDLSKKNISPEQRLFSAMFGSGKAF